MQINYCRRDFQNITLRWPRKISQNGNEIRPEWSRNSVQEKKHLITNLTKCYLMHLKFLCKLREAFETKANKFASSRERLWLHWMHATINGDGASSVFAFEWMDGYVWRSRAWLLHCIVEANQSFDTDWSKAKSWVDGTEMGAMQNINFISTYR